MGGGGAAQKEPGEERPDGDAEGEGGEEEPREGGAGVGEEEVKYWEEEELILVSSYL